MASFFIPSDEGHSLFELSEEAKVRHEVDFNNKTTTEMEAKLGQLQIVLVVDYSGSMKLADGDAFGQGRTLGLNSKPWSRWDNCFQTVKCIAEAMFTYDKDGKIPTYFFSNSVEEHVFRNVDEMYAAFRTKVPSGKTDLLAALEMAITKHLNENDNTLFVVLTDGAPNFGQEDRIKHLIRSTVSHADPKGERVNMLFIRHGDDEGAIKFLKDLDDCKEIGNNVDTKSDNAVNAMGPKNLILNAIFEHLDAKA